MFLKIMKILVIILKMLFIPVMKILNVELKHLD